MPKWLKHWKWQCLLSAPLLPWLYIHWATWVYETMIALGWTYGKMGGVVVATAILTICAIVVFIIGYCMIHDDARKGIS